MEYSRVKHQASILRIIVRYKMSIVEIAVSCGHLL